MKAGWAQKRLSDVCEKITDGTHQTPKYFESGHVFLSSKNVTTGKIDWENVKYIDETQHLAMQKRLSPRKGDILLAKNGTTGVAAVVDKEVSFDIYVSLACLRPLKFVLPEFLLHFINSNLAKEQFNRRLKGVGVPNLHLEEIREVVFPLPPLEEQRRIVAILDETFEGLDRARANAEANLRNARELTDLATEQCLAGAEAASVCSTRLGNIASFRNGLNFRRGGRGETIKLVGVGDFKDHFQVQTHLLSEISLDGELGSDHQLQEGDLLAVRSNGNKELFGRTMLVPRLDEKTTFSGFTIRIRLRSEEVLPEYVCELMRSKKLRRLMIDGGGGASISNLNQQILDALPISFPAKDEQRAILERIEELRSQARLLARSYEAQNTDLQALRQSLLQKAFAGELTRVR